MSPEATSPALRFITYYNPAFPAAGHNMSTSKSIFTERICHPTFQLFVGYPDNMVLEKNTRAANQYWLGKQGTLNDFSNISLIMLTQWL